MGSDCVMEPLEFQWGKAGARGKIPGVQFYNSFRFDGTDYELHDCVYMWKEGITQPYIGKLVKIWGRDEKVKRVKVQWFFRPCEISYYLKDKEVLKNELFFASGKGAGVFNVNPLESIAGKCNVVCISKDIRNLQPSDEELCKADYVFYRIFDVDNFSIFHNWGDHVGELEVKFIFNRTLEIANNSGPPFDGLDVRNGKNKHDHPMMDSSKDQESKSEEKRAPSIVKDTQARDLMKESEVLEKRPAKRRLNIEVGDDESEEKRPTKRLNIELVDNGSKDTYQIVVGGKEKIGSSKDSTVLANRPHLDFLSNLTKRRKVDQDVEFGNTKFTSKFDDDSRSYALSKSSNNSKSSAVEKPKKFVVSRRPNVEKNTWFNLPWEDRMLPAQKHGTLILLQNLDPEYTSGEVEDIIWHAFNEKCSAKMVQRTAFSSPVCGLALVILRSKEVVDKVLKRLCEDCLMLPNGRPLVGGPARLPKVSENHANFVGHMSINKIKHKIQKQMKEAVSTSHYSQPNTIEFEMSMDWFLIQARSSMSWEKLYKKQADQIKELKSIFKSKQNAK